MALCILRRKGAYCGRDMRPLQKLQMHLCCPCQPQATPMHLRRSQLCRSLATSP